MPLSSRIDVFATPRIDANLCVGISCTLKMNVGCSLWTVILRRRFQTLDDLLPLQRAAYDLTALLLTNDWHLTRRHLQVDLVQEV